MAHPQMHRQKERPGANAGPLSALSGRGPVAAYGADEAGGAAAVAAMAEDEAEAEDADADAADDAATPAAFSAVAAEDSAAAADESAAAVSFLWQAVSPKAATALMASTRPKVLFMWRLQLCPKGE
jgi:hypothetical protein